MTITIAQLRVLVDDPTGVDQIFDDAHYEVIIDIESNVYRAAATAAKTLAAHFAEKITVTAGPVKVATQQKFEHYDALADSYDQRAREGGGSGADEAAMAPALAGTSISTINDLNSDTDRYKGAFSRGQDDNPPGSLNDDDNVCG